MKLRCIKICIILGYLAIGNAMGDSGLWCYECNADLSQGRKAECNDPYAPAPSTHLVECPRNDSYACFKGLIFYRNVHVTVRGCVPSGEKNTYCSFKEAFPEASLECLFCNDYACNVSQKSAPSWTSQCLIIASIIMSLAFSERLNL